MADLLELPVTEVEYSPVRFGFVWWPGSLSVLELGPWQRNWQSMDQPIYTKMTAWSGPLMAGQGQLIATKIFSPAADLVGLNQQDIQSVAAWVDWNNSASGVVPYDRFNKGQTANEATQNTSEMKNWGTAETAPFLCEEIDFETEISPPPPGIPPCDGGGGSERPDYGMIYPRKV